MKLIYKYQKTFHLFLFLICGFGVELYAAENTLTRLNKFLQTETFAAAFTQKVYDEKQSLVGDSVGTVTIQRPGKFRWEYLKPSRQLIVSDGVNLLNYDPELEQAIIQPLIVSLGYAPIMLLSGDNVSPDKFEIDIAGHHQNLDWIVLIPKVQDTEFTRIELGFNRETLVKIKMHDHFQQVTLIHFLRAQFGVDIKKDTFRVYLPTGTDIIGDYIMPPARKVHVPR